MLVFINKENLEIWKARNDDLEDGRAVSGAKGK